MPNNRCSNCVSFNSECTHNAQRKEDKLPRRKRMDNKKADSATPEATTSRNPPQNPETVKHHVDVILSETAAYQAPKERTDLIQLLVDVSRYARSLEQEIAAYRQSQSPPSDGAHIDPAPSGLNEDQDTAGEDGEVIEIHKLPDHLRRIVSSTANHRFFGESSSLMFVKAAIEAPKEHPGCIPVTNSTSGTRRPEFWTTYPWEAPPEPRVLQIFPPDDLLRDLVDIYFTQVNIYSLILHRSTFENSIADGLHLRDHRFGATVLAVCALASKNSSDRRVMLPGSQNELSAGWEWFRQIRRPFGGPVVQPTSLYELQLCCLSIMFLQAGSDVESCWLLSGIGILHAQDIGAHLRKDKTEPLTKEDEMLKRSFQYLFIFDAIVSACFGRPLVAHRSDLDLPVAWADEYGEPDRAFEQPSGKPPLVAYPIAYLNLMKIFTCSWRSMRILDSETIAEMDSRLNKWAEEIPEHLLWNPYMEDDVFFDQSSTLYASYYHVQIMIHRPFMRKKRNSSSSTFKSLAICSNAARSCSHIADVKRGRGFMPHPHLLKAAFDSAIVLLLNIWSGKKSGLSIDPARELVDVYKCMTLLRQSERRWQCAGRYYDILCELMRAGNLIPPSLSEVSTDIWTGDSNNNRDAPSEAHLTDSHPSSGCWPALGTIDLGRLPIYGSLDTPNGFPLSKMDVFDESSLGLPRTTSSPNKPGTGDSLPNPFVNKIEQNGPSETPFEYLDEYMLDWVPYFSTVDEMVQDWMGA
ncbi:hypothetical protein B0H10DRAFT_1987446 [Mycena sp. CBHHK59/15]|nr:hypothetical protein B0H10DRAFT_1987446 [Mycena sp. CBHHK59/15]